MKQIVQWARGRNIHTIVDEVFALTIHQQVRSVMNLFPWKLNQTFNHTAKTHMARKRSQQQIFFPICIRLAFTQARVWELTNDSLLYESPPDFVEEDTHCESHLPGLCDDFAAKGHLLEAAFRGQHAGHKCQRCQK